jgi:putative ABC transport system permease protein
MYAPALQSSPGWSAYSLMIRTSSGDPVAVIPGVRAAIRSLDATAVVGSVESMNDLIGHSLGRPKFYFSLLGTFAGIAMLLAVAGLYGVLSYAVAQRTREMGIRTALGSPRGTIVRLIAMDGFRLVIAGVILGLAGGAAVTRLMAFMLYGISRLDQTTWLVAVALMIISAMAAAMIPAWRAARVDPLVAIQIE